MQKCLACMRVYKDDAMISVKSADEQRMLDNIVSIVEHSVTYISHPTDEFLTQVEADVAQLMLNGAPPVSVLFCFLPFLTVI